MNTLKGKTVLLLGARGDVMLALVRAFQREGARPVCYLSNPDAHSRGSIPDGALNTTVRLRNLAEVARPIDILVMCLSPYRAGEVADQQPSAAGPMATVGLLCDAVQAVLPSMISAQRRQIVTIYPALEGSEFGRVNAAAEAVSSITRYIHDGVREGNIQFRAVLSWKIETRAEAEALAAEIVWLAKQSPEVPSETLIFDGIGSSLIDQPLGTSDENFDFWRAKPGAPFPDSDLVS